MLTREQKRKIIFQVFYKFDNDFWALRGAAPDVPDEVTIGFVNEAYNELMTWIEND